MSPEKHAVIHQLSRVAQHCGAVGLIALIAFVMSPWALAQSSGDSSSQAQSGQKPQDTAPEAGGPVEAAATGLGVAGSGASCPRTVYIPDNPYLLYSRRCVQPQAEHECDAEVGWRITGAFPG